MAFEAERVRKDSVIGVGVPVTDARFRLLGTLGSTAGQLGEIGCRAWSLVVNASPTESYMVHANLVSTGKPSVGLSFN